MDIRLIIALVVLGYGLWLFLGMGVALLTAHTWGHTRFERLAMISLIPLFIIGTAFNRAWRWFFVDRQ